MSETRFSSVTAAKVGTTVPSSLGVRVGSLTDAVRRISICEAVGTTVTSSLGVRVGGLTDAVRRISIGEAVGTTVTSSIGVRVGRRLDGRRPFSFARRSATVVVGTLRSCDILHMVGRCFPLRSCRFFQFCHSVRAKVVVLRLLWPGILWISEHRRKSKSMFLCINQYGPMTIQDGSHTSSNTLKIKIHYQNNSLFSPSTANTFFSWPESNAVKKVKI